MRADSGTVATPTPVAFLADRKRLVWVAAFVLYGVGDTVTTFWGLSTGGIAEAGPVVAPLVDAYGRAALLAVKVAVFVGFYTLWRSLRTPGRVAVPLALATVGGVVTAWNLVVITGV